MESCLSVPPSAEVLGEAARRVAAAYPDLYAHQRSGHRVPAVAPARDPRRRHGSRQDAPGRHRRCARPQPDGPYLVICPAGVKLDLGARDPRRRARRRRPHRLRQQGPRPGARWTIVNYDLLGKHAQALAAARWAGVVVDEAHYIKNDSRAHEACPPARRASMGAQPAAGRGLPAHGHADDQPPARPVQPPARRPPPAGDLVLQLRQALLRGLRQRLRPRQPRRLQRRGARLDRGRRHAPAHQGRGARPAAQDPHLAAGRGRLGAAVRRDEAAALDFFARNPRARRPAPGATFLGMLNHARHTLAAGQGATPRSRPSGSASRRARRSSCSAATRRSSTGWRTSSGDAARTITGSTPAADRQAAADAFQQDPAVRVLLGNLQAAGVGPDAHGRHPRRLQRPRLGARQPLAGGGPHLPHRPDAARRS